MSAMSNLGRLLVAVSMLFAAAACDDGSVEGPGASVPMKIGLMLNFSGAPETAADRKRAFDLAIRHVNKAGGVLGRPVEGVEADSTLDPQVGVEAARRLVESEGVHAIVGPTASVIALPVAEMVTGPAGVPTISPSATSPQLTVAADNGYFFRTTLSDTAQGPVLARLTGERGFDNVGLVYIDDPYGQGLFRSFEESWDGQLRSVPVDRDQTNHLADLQESASAGAQALVVITFEQQALDIVREGLEEGIYTQFVFGDAAKRLSLVTEIGGERLGDMHGTAGAPAPDNDATAAWEAAFAAAYGGPPQIPYVKETYDATVALALAAQAAGSLDGAAIRDQLRAIGSPPGETVLGTPDGVAEGLRLLAAGRQIDYEGAANSLDWDSNGDLLQGYIGIWRYTRNERIEELDTIRVQY
ncbi:MAG: ABC transporter substrate-binding protein [Acidimicrobiia bacterium]|nr:ABC transporter substrate-binding protein [Acidimicrobiia bacterium]